MSEAEHACEPTPEGHEPTWSLVEPFDIDNGELDGLSGQECFVLGVEWAIVRHLLEGGGGFCKTVHAASVQRLVNLGRRSGRELEVRHGPDGWADIYGLSTTAPA